MVFSIKLKIIFVNTQNKLYLFICKNISMSHSSNKFILDGLKFSNKTEFYQHLQLVLTKDLDWSIGNNLDAFSDILQGGYGTFEMHAPITITWKNFKKSEEILGSHYINKLLNTIHEQNHITLEIEI